MELKVKFLPSLLQCIVIYGYALQLRAKKKKLFIILQLIKIIFVTLFFSILLFSKQCLSQTHSLKLSPLCLTFSQNFLSNSHFSISLPPTRINPQCHRPPKLNVIDPPADPLCRTPKQPIHLRPMPPIHFFDALNSFKLTLSYSHLFVPPPPPPIHTSDPTRLQVSCLCLLHLHAWDF